MLSLGMVGPAIALVGWTLVLWIWMYYVRITAMQKTKVDMQDVALAGFGPKDLPKHATSVANNYNHLHEQPTIFYALCLSMQVMDLFATIDVWIAWAYVLCRIVHSVVQNIIHDLMMRFSIFVIGSIAIFILFGRLVLGLI